jgi:regulatory protein
VETDKKKAKARNNAYALLRSRPRSEFELRQRLHLKGYSDSTIGEVVEDLRHSGLLDDGKFAKFWIESRMHLNPAGDVVLRHELKSKGVTDPVIESALEAKGRAYDERGIALSMARERFERLRKFDKRKAVKRLYDFLVRRGFKYDTVREVIEELTGIAC